VQTVLMRSALLALLPLVAFEPQGHAAQKPKTKTNVIADCQDPVGSLFVFELREALRRSSGYTFDPEGTLVINLVCLDTAGEGEPKGLSSAISVLVTVPYGGSWSNCPATAIVSHLVIHVGGSKTEVMATRLLAQIDNDLHR
jgi:hypothetical protein